MSPGPADQDVTPDARKDAAPTNYDILDSRIERALDKRNLGSGGDGPYNPGMEARVAKLESSMEHLERDVGDIKADIRGFRMDLKSNTDSLRTEMAVLRQNDSTDFKIIFGAIIAVALGLAGLMARGFHWI